MVYVCDIDTHRRTNDQVNGRTQSILINKNGSMIFQATKHIGIEESGVS